MESRQDYYNKVEELKKVLRELELYCSESQNPFWGIENKDIDFHSMQEYARIRVAESAIRTMSHLASNSLWL